jgi:hypothetical protein
MTYGIFSLESANALSWFDSEDAAFEAARRILRGEPEARESLGIMQFDDSGHPVGSLYGQELLDALQGGVPAQT